MVTAYGEAVALGVLQGLTEFLPVSSDGHLALAEMLFDLSGGGLVLNTMLHLGTLLATVVVLFGRVREMFRAGFGALRRPSTLRSTQDGRDVIVVVLASVPTAIIGLGLRHQVERWTLDPLVVGLGFVATATVLLSTAWARDRDRKELTVSEILLLGVAQGVAVLPGVSRSGCTIALLLWIGLRSTRAFELSMLVSLPAILGAVALELPKALGLHGALGPALVGALVGFAVGVVALRVLRGVLARRSFAWFSAWVAPVAIATLAFARAWPGR
jgi:undecaprenyl-diphosphatase